MMLDVTGMMTSGEDIPGVANTDSWPSVDSVNPFGPCGSTWNSSSPPHAVQCFPAPACRTGCNGSELHREGLPARAFLVSDTIKCCLGLASPYRYIYTNRYT